MANRKRQLVAWTRGGQVRMLPSLVQESAQPFIQRIDDLENSRPHNFQEQPRYLISLSHAYEALGRFYERFGHIREAFDAFVQAAITVTRADEYYWSDCDEGFILDSPFRERFFAVYGHCRKMLREHPALKDTPACEALLHGYRRLTAVTDSWHREMDEIREANRAWRFGA